MTSRGTALQQRTTFSAPALSFTQSIARAAALRLMQKIQKGRLQVELPDGTTHTFGELPGPTARLHVHDWNLFGRVLVSSDVGLAEGYIRGEWDVDHLEAFIQLLALNMVSLDRRTLWSRLGSAAHGLAHRLAANTRRGSRRNISAHYDLGNDFYGLWLDETMTYSSAVFSNPWDSLKRGQINKYRRMGALARIRPGDRILEIGCGWGGFAEYAASQLGAHVTAVTLSRQQAEYAQQRIADAGLSDRVEVVLEDYRDLSGQYDAVVSIEMLEAVGHRFLPTFFGQVDALLAPHGVAAIQVITIPEVRYEDALRKPDFIKTHIFPGGHIPSLTAILDALRGTDLMIHEAHNIGLDYARTLRRWKARFLDALDEVEALGFDSQFVRMWDYYLTYCAAAFATRSINTHQLTLTRQANVRLAERDGDLG